MPNEQEILNALKAIVDPDFKKDIVSLGFIKNLKVAGGDVSFDIELTTPACPVKNEFQQAARELVGQLQGVKQVNVNMTSQPTRQRSFPTGQSGLQKVKSIIAVSSCKGGVGKSTVAAGLARELAQGGYQVGLLDADIFGPSVPTLFNLHNAVVESAGNNMFKPLEINGLKILSFGFWSGDNPAVMRGPMVSNYVQQLLHQTQWGELDYLFIDMPPGTGDIQLTISQTVQLDGAVIVTTPQALSLADVGKGILMFDKVNVPVLGVIENMAYFICDQCDKKHHIFGGDAAERLKERFGVEILAQLPISTAFNTTFDKRGEIAVLKQATDEVIRALGKNAIRAKEKPAIQFDEKAVTLRWADGSSTRVENFTLRTNCKCARCVDEISGEQVLSEKDIRKDIKADEVSVIGNYAISVKWNDGHATGLFPYHRIRELSRSVTV